MIFQSSFLPEVERTSALGFGTNRLMAVESSAERERIFSKLLDAGVNHFDTAAYYGYGAAERILGELSRQRRNAISITTKFGIQPPQLLKSGVVNRLARRVLKQVPQLRTLLSRGAQAVTKQGAFSVDDARRSLEASLRALNTSYVDLFLLHEPTLSDALNDDLVAFLQNQVAAGTIRAFGCGGNFGSIGPIGAEATRHTYLQFEDSLTQPNRELAPAQRKLITYGCITGLPGQLMVRLQRNPALLKRWNERLGRDCSSSAALVTLLVAAALARNASGLVLFSSSRLEHLDAVLAAAQGSTAGETAHAFWELARAELSRGEDAPTLAFAP